MFHVNIFMLWPDIIQFGRTRSFYYNIYSHWYVIGHLFSMCGHAVCEYVF